LSSMWVIRAGIYPQLLLNFTVETVVGDHYPDCLPNALSWYALQPICQICHFNTAWI